MKDTEYLQVVQWKKPDFKIQQIRIQIYIISDSNTTISVFNTLYHVSAI